MVSYLSKWPTIHDLKAITKLIGMYRQEHDWSRMDNDVNHMNRVVKTLLNLVKEEDGTCSSTKRSKKIGYILETIRRQAQDSRKDEFKDSS